MNLLPEYKKKVIGKETFLKFLFVVLGIVSLWAMIFLILAYNIIFYLQIQIPALEARIQVEQSSKSIKHYTDVERDINELNAALAQIDNIRGKGFFDFPKILRELGSLIPEGIFFTSLSYRGDALVIAGHADTRAQALLFKSNLEKDSLCKTLSSPVIVRETNIDFTFVCAFKESFTPKTEGQREELLEEKL